MCAMIKALDICEWDSNKHRVFNLDVKPGIGIYNELAITPLANREAPQAGALYSLATFNTKAAGCGTAGTAPFDDALVVIMIFYY